MAQVSLKENQGAVQAQEAKQTLVSCLMYLYQGHLAQGLPDKEAKQLVADELVGLVEQWSSTTGLTFQAGMVVNPLRTLEEAIALAKDESTKNPSLPNRMKFQAIHRKLVDLKAMTKKEAP